MFSRNPIQSYINNFRRHLSRYLKPRIGLSCKVYPVERPGAILEFQLGPDILNEDQYLPPYKSMSEALGELRQQAFGGNLAAFSFKGTNIILEENRLILIKGGDSPEEWDDRAAAADVKQIVSRMGAPKAP
jgi:hypothetical protein